jgi:prepilin-type N-terminal cleavage/methylation domain-containing protein
MIRLSILRKRGLRSFTLVELLVVLAIIALLVSLLQPALRSALLHAQSIKCVTNLRSIGVAVQLATSDNNNLYPLIDQAAAPIYSPAGSVPGLVGVLGPYGINTNSIQCPVDMASSPSAFTQYGSSYEWNPAFDDENPNDTVIYYNQRTGNRAIPINSSRVRLCTDFLPLHHNKVYALYGDGHVVAR